MKYFYYLTLAAVFVLAGCGSGSEHNHSHGMHGEEHSDNNHSDNHKHEDGVIVIHGHQAEELGIKVKEVNLMPFVAPVKAVGEVMYNPSNQGVISAPMSGRLNYGNGVSAGIKVSRGARIGVVSTTGMAGGDQLQAARIEFETAQKEVDRLQPLRQEGIVTVGEYNQALANLERARNNLAGGAGSVVTAPMSGIISSLSVGEGGYVNAGDVIGEIVGDGGMTLRVDVPVGSSPNLSNADTIKVKFPHIDELINATAMSGKSNTSTAPGYISLYYQLPATDNVVAGSYADVYLPSNVESDVVAVPLSALSDRMGQKMVYVKEHGTDHYMRVPVTTGATDGELVEVRGIEPGTLVVTEGVTFVRLAENSGAVPPGHSHNH